MSNKLLVGWRPYAIAAVALCVLAVLYFVVQAQTTGSRFGDPAVLEQIKTSTDCDALKTWSDAALTADSHDGVAFDQAVGYSNAANDRIKELNC